MRRSSTLALTSAVLLSLGGTVSPARGQDVPPAPVQEPQEPAPPLPPKEDPQVPPPEPAAPSAPEDGTVPPAPPAESAAPAVLADVPTDEEDAKARELLTAAADRQGGATLAAPDGRLESFRVVFHKVTLWRTKDGTGARTRVDSETPGLIVHWKGGQLRTEWRIQGDTPVVRGVMFRKKADGTSADYPWLWDGTTTTSLLNEAYRKDRDEIDRDRKIVKALLEVAVLRAMLSDGSRWKVVEDPTFEGTAIRRTPPAGAETPLRLTLWIDPKSRDVVGAKLAPNEPDESTMVYGLEYHPEFPKVKDGVLRFPFKFTVREQRVAEQEPFPVMEAMASEASFNDVPDTEFRPPK